MPTTINGLPAHILVIHVIVVFAPLAALMLVLSAVWPAARRRIGVVGPIVSLITLIFVPITTSAGEWLRDKLPQGHSDPLIRKHADLGQTFLVFAVGLLLASAAVWWFGRKYEFGLFGLTASSTPEPATEPTGGGGIATLAKTDRTVVKNTVATWVSVVIAVVATVVAVVVVWQLYRIGDSGAKAAWDYVHQLK